MIQLVVKRNMVNEDYNAGKRSQDNYKKNNVKHWSPPTIGLLKGDTSYSRINARLSSTFGLVCMHNIGRVQQNSGKAIGNC